MESPHAFARAAPSASVIEALDATVSRASRSEL
jgi:hypothetical protein